MAAKAGRLQIQLEMQVAQLQRDLDKATRSIDGAVNNWQSTFKGVFTADLFSNALQRIGGAVSRVIDDMGRITDESAKLGDTAEMYQRMAYAAELAGVSMDALVAASGKLQKELGEGSKDTEAALRALGLSIEDLRRVSTGEALIKVAGALGELDDAAKRATTGASLLGKGWQTLLPAFADGEAAFRRAADSAIVASEAARQAGDDFGDAIGEMQKAVEVFLAEAMAPLLPLLTQSAKEFTAVGNNASGAAEGVDRATSSARQLGETLATAMESVGAFRDILNSLQDTLVGTTQATRGGWRWPWESDDNLRDPVKSLDDLANAWSRFTTHFNDVQSGVSSTEDLAKATRAVVDATDEETKTVKAGTVARKESNKEKQATLDLDELLAGAQARVEESWARTDQVLTDRVLAQAEWNGLSRDELEILELQLQGYSDRQLAVVQETQSIRTAIEERTRSVQEAAATAQAYQDTLVRGFDDIFYSMTQGADQAEEAVARLVTELAAMYLQMLALNTLKQFNGNGSWGFQGVAKGAAFDPSGMMPFAQGGIVRNATAFTFGGGRLGVMGEAGPEAILPLGRDAQGRLGVRGGGLNVSVHNYGGARVDVEQRGQDVAILIDQVRGVIANDFARGGNKVTTALEGAYGVRR